MLANGLVQIETVNEDKSIKITGLLPKTDTGKRTKLFLKFLT